MKILNLEALKQNFDNDVAFILDITKEYCKYSKKSIEKLLQAHNNNNWDEMLILVHSLKGSSRTIYAEEISEIFVELENRLKEKTEDLEKIISMISPAFNKLEHFISQLGE